MPGSIVFSGPCGFGKPTLTDAFALFPGHKPDALPENQGRLSDSTLLSAEEASEKPELERFIEVIQRMKKNGPRSLAMLTASVLIFGTIGLFRRWLPLPSAWIAFFRGMIGCAFLALLRLGSKGRRKGAALSGRSAALLALTGGMIGCNWILLFEAYNYTNVPVATLCYYMQPTLVVILASVFLKERLTAKKVVCALLALLGMALISGIPETGLPTGRDLKGILLGLGAACLYAGVVLMNKRLSGVDAHRKTILQLGAAAVVLLPYLPFAGDPGIASAGAGTLALLLLVGVVHTGVAYALYFRAMDGLRAQTVALFSYLDPVAALILSALFLGERLTPVGLVGAALILGAAAACEMGE